MIGSFQRRELVVITPEGRAGVGDFIRDPWGAVLEVVSVESAGTWCARKVQHDIDNGTPNFTRDSIGAMCIRSGGETTGREKRNYERWKARRRPQYEVPYRVAS